MKGTFPRTLRMLIVAVVLLGGGNVARSQFIWNELPSGTTYSLFDITFPDATHGFVVGGDSAYRTTNGGESWARMSLASPIFLCQLVSVDFKDQMHGIIVGGTISAVNRPVYFQTTDGGATWRQESFEPDLLGDLFSHVAYANGDTAYICSGNYHTAHLLKSTNNGANWALVPNPTPTGDSAQRYYTQSAWRDGSNGMVISAMTSPFDWQLWMTSDGGTTWRECRPFGDSAASLVAVTHVSEKTWLVAGGDIGAIARTTDDGLTWTVVANTGADTIGTIHDIDFSGGMCMAVGTSRDMVLISGNDGASWISYPLVPNAHMRAVDMTGPYAGYVAGDDGKIYSFFAQSSVGSSTESRARLGVTPLPTRGPVTVTVNDSSIERTLTVYDELGQVVDRHRVAAGVTVLSIDLSERPGGVYTIRIGDDACRVVVVR